MPKTYKSFFNKAIQQAPSADNSQPWKIHWQGNTLSILYDTDRAREKTFPADSPATLLSIGAATENLFQAASALDIKISPHTLPPFNSSTPIYFQADITPPKTSAKITDTSLPLFQRHTNRFRYQAKSIAPPILEGLKKLTRGSARVMVIDYEPMIKEISQLVRSASEIRFRTREIHEWLGRSLRFGRQAEQCNDGLDVATLDLPPGGALFLRLISDWQRMRWLNLLSAYRFMAWIDSLPVKQAPALIAITGQKGFEGALQAGQLMQRTWIELNSQGVAVHPYYVLSDQMNRLQDGTVPADMIAQAKAVSDGVNHLFNLNDNETLYMLFRIGYPTQKAKRSKRLALDRICSGDWIK